MSVAGPENFPRGLKLCIDPSCNPMARRPCILLPGQLNTLFRDFPRPYVGDRNGKRTDKNVQMALVLINCQMEKQSLGEDKEKGTPPRSVIDCLEGDFQRGPVLSHQWSVHKCHQAHTPCANLLAVSISREDMEPRSGSSPSAVHRGWQLLSVEIRSCRKPGSEIKTLSTVNTSTTGGNQ